MFKKYKEKKRLREEQNKIVDFFLKEHNIESKIEKSIFTDNPFVVTIWGRPSEDVRKAIADTGYGEILEPFFGGIIYRANPKKFNTEKLNDYKESYEFIKKHLLETIELKKRVGGERHIYEYVDAPHLCLDSFYAMEDKLKSDFPTLSFEIHISHFCFANDSVLVSGNF